MTKKMRALCLVASALFSTGSFGSSGSDFDIYYINGMNCTVGDANRGVSYLSAFVPSSVGSANIGGMYQDNVGSYTSMIAKVGALGYSDPSNKKYSNFWTWLSKPDIAPAWFLSQVVYANALSETNYVQSATTQAMTNTVLSSYGNNRKVILVGHSQGTFYANQVWNSINSTNSAAGACVGIVSAAELSSYVANSGQYTTRTDDAAVNGMRVYAPWGSGIPSGNITGTYSPSDPVGHNFVKSYMSPSTVRSQIQSQIDSVASQINSTCVFPTPPSSCGTPINSSGSSGKSQYTLTIGQGTHSVVANFQAYTIPDALKMFANGTTLADTNGLVSGLHSYAFTFDSQKLGTSLTAEVTGNDDPGTEWTLCVDCDNSSTCAGSIPQRQVTIGFSYTPIQPNDWTCSAGSISIDGQSQGNMANGASVTMALSASTDSHSLSAPGEYCNCNLQLGCTTGFYTQPHFHISYKDGNGKAQSIDVPLATSATFIIN